MSKTELIEEITDLKGQLTQSKSLIRCFLNFLGRHGYEHTLMCKNARKFLGLK